MSSTAQDLYRHVVDLWRRVDLVHHVMMQHGLPARYIAPWRADELRALHGLLHHVHLQQTLGRRHPIGGDA